jgi:hypothetical protein
MDDYELCIDLYTFLAQMYLASGQLTEIPGIVGIIRIYSKSSKDRIPADVVDLARIRMQGKLELHIDESISLLRRLGVRLRRRGYFWFQAQDKKRRIKSTLNSMSNEEIQSISLERKAAQDMTAMLVEHDLIHTLLYVQGGEMKPMYTNLAVVVASKMVEAFLKGQSSPDFYPVCLTLAACLFCNTQTIDKHVFLQWVAKLLGMAEESDLALSIRLAELAQALPGVDHNVQMIGVVGLIRHWRRPLTNCTEILLKGYNIGMKRYECATRHFSLSDIASHTSRLLFVVSVEIFQLLSR